MSLQESFGVVGKGNGTGGNEGANASPAAGGTANRNGEPPKGNGTRTGVVGKGNGTGDGDAGSNPPPSSGGTANRNAEPSNGGTANRALTSDQDKGSGSSLAGVLEKKTGASTAPGQQTNQTENLPLPEWADQLPKSMLDNAALVQELSGFKAVQDLVDAYVASKGKQAAPGEKATASEIQTFYESLGTPKDAASYSVAQDSGGKEFAALAFELHLTEAQASKIWMQSKSEVQGLLEGIQTRQAQDIVATDALLHKEYGDKYDEALALFDRGVGTGVVPKLLKDAGLFGKPEIVRAFIELGRNTAEGGGLAPMGQGGKELPQSVMQGRGFSYKNT